MDDYTCPKYKFHDFAKRQGWLLLYDSLKDDGSSVGYLLQNGNSIVADFDAIGNLTAMTDITNARITSKDNSEETKESET